MFNVGKNTKRAGWLCSEKFYFRLENFQPEILTAGIKTVVTNFSVYCVILNFSFR